MVTISATVIITTLSTGGALHSQLDDVVNIPRS